jgi:hypothetical protein
VILFPAGKLLEVGDMRATTLLLSLLLLAGCATSKPSADDYVTRTGVIVSKAVVDLEESAGGSKINSSVSVSASSGGGVAIGLGFLLGSLSRSAEKPPVRYGVELEDGEQITVFHESDVFETGDCVEIKSLPDDAENLPVMKRRNEGCEDISSP